MSEFSADCESSCPAGYSRDVDSILGDGFECTVIQTSCTCSELPPLERGLIGRYASLATDGVRLYVSAYAEDYGDLVVGVRGPEQDLGWMWVDGVPAGRTSGCRTHRTSWRC